MFKIFNNTILVCVFSIILVLNAYGMQPAAVDEDTLTHNLSTSKLANEFFEKGMEQYEEDNLDSAIDYLKKAISIDNKFAEARKKLIEIYMNHKNLLYKMMAEMELKKAIMDNPENFGYNLNLARTYLKHGFIYNDKKVLESFEYILSDSEKEEYEQLSDVEREKFINKHWKRKDPVYLTEVNERRLEHFNRFAYSNLNFSVPKMGIDGWQSDRGKIYIRYGKPKRIDPDPKTGFNPYIIWYYPKFAFVFYVANSTGEYRLSTYRGRSGIRVTDSEEIEKNLKEVYPESYDYDYGGRLFALNYFTACFRGKNGNTHMEIYYSIPQNCIQYNPGKERFTARIKEGLFIFDDDLNEVKRDISVNEFYSNDFPDNTWSTHIFRRNNLEIQPGNYMLAIEIQDESSKNTGMRREAISVESFEYNNLKLSDIVLGITIDTTLSKSEFTSSGFENMPNPALSYIMDQPVYLYYEIYNLRLGPPGVTNYTVEYKIDREKKKRPAIVKLFSGLGRLIGIKGKKEEISTLYKYSGIDPTEKQYLTINMKGNEPGVYHISLSVTDLNSSQKVSKHRIVSFTDKVRHYLVPP